MLLLASCSSNDEQPAMNTSTQNLPGDYVLTKDESIFEQDPSVAKYTYIYTNKSAMFRDDILKSYPLEELIKEEHCVFTIAESTCDGSQYCYTLQLKDDPSRFLTVGLSSNKEEVHLKIYKVDLIVPVGSQSYYAPAEDETEARFYFHKMEDVKGVPTYAIESVAMPGWYISDSPPGFNYAANVVTFQEDESPESAPKWQCRSVD